MQAELRILPRELKDPGLKAGYREALISLKVPANQAVKVAAALKSFLDLAGHEVRHISNRGEPLVEPEEVFANITPRQMLRGIRTKEGLTQTDFAARLGITQNMVSDMESGRRNISLNMARRISNEFKVPYKIFLSSIG